MLKTNFKLPTTDEQQDIIILAMIVIFILTGYGISNQQETLHLQQEKIIDWTKGPVEDFILLPRVGEKRAEKLDLQRHSSSFAQSEKDKLPEDWKEMIR